MRDFQMADAIRRLDAGHCETAMSAGEFGAEVVGAAPSVAVILTQSWCPQWTMTRLWLDAALKEAGAVAWYVEYDREAFFDRFMAWKEDVLGNRTIPYIRYYADGKLSAESNFVSKAGFVARLGKKGAGA